MSILDPALRNALRTLKLTGMLDTLDARLAQTRDGTLGHLDFLQVLCEDEIARRDTVKCWWGIRPVSDTAAGIQHGRAAYAIRRCSGHRSILTARHSTDRRLSASPTSTRCSRRHKSARHPLGWGPTSCGRGRDQDYRR